MSATRTVRHKQVRVDQTKLDKARKILGARTDSETLDRALDLVVDEGRIDRVLRSIGGQGGLRRVFS